MSIDQASPLVPIKPQVSLQNGAFIKNSHNRSSFCGVAPSSNGNGTFKTFAVNRKSWSGNVTLPLQQFTPDVEQAPQLATFRSGTGTFPRNRERNNNTTNGILTPNGNSVQTFKGNEVRRCGSSNGRRYAEIGNWNKRNDAVSPMNQLLCTLRFYATGSQLITCGDMIGVHESTACRIVHRVTHAIASLSSRYIKFPSSAEEQTNVAAEYYAIARFPRVLGAIDCTHVRIMSPGGDNAEIYRNRKGYFSINTQCVAAANLSFLDIVARWHGSAHDSNIWDNCALKRNFIQGRYPNKYLLGDSGYAQTHTMMTPLPDGNVRTRGEQLYQEAQIKTRNVVERAFGVWKRRFPILSRGISVNLNKIPGIIVATAVLHNLAIEQREDVPPVDEEYPILPEEIRINVPAMQPQQRVRNLERTILIEQYFSRNATFLEPHLQGIRRRDSRSSDSDHDERSTEDDERSLLRNSPRTRLPPPPPPPPDDEPPPLKPREFFERLQTQAMREAQERKHRSRDIPIKDSNQLFRPVDADGSLGDSLSQSRESLSSDGEGARGDCSSVDSSGSGSEEQPPCVIGLLERLIRTHPVWFLPGIQRAGAFHLLQGKEEGNFVVRQSSQADTMAISVRLPADKGPYIEHYLIQAAGGRIGLETSHNRFDNIPELIAHYSQCCDELPVQLQLPRPLREAKSRHQLSSLALLGQEFWGYPMANPKNNPNNLLSPCQLANGVVPMAVTPSDTGSSLSSFNASTRTNSREHILSPDKDQNVVLKMSPIDTSGSPPNQNQNLSTFKGKTAPSPPAKPNSAFIRAPRPTPPNTLNLMSSTAHITQPHTFPTTNTQHSPTQSNNIKMTPPPPPPRWAKPPFSKPSLSPKTEAFSPINKMAQNGNITVTTTVTFCVNNTQIHNHQINESIKSNRLQLTLASNANNNNSSADSVFVMDTTKNIADSNGESQNMIHRMSPEGECINAMTASLHGSFKRQMTEQNTVDPGSPVEPQSQTNTSDSADPIVNSFTKSSITFAPNQLVSPNGTNSVTSGIFSPTSQINSPVSNDTISSKSGVFSPLSQTNKSEIFSPVSRSSPISAKNVFSPTSNQTIISPMMGKERDKVMSPNTNTASTTPSGRSRRSKHSHRKESRHYQESDILESPGVYCRSTLMDKVSDYEDIWGPESNNSCSTFKPLKVENENNIHNGLMKSKRPDLLPDTLPKLNAAKSTQSILEKENMHIIINSTESLNEKKTLSDSSLKKSFKGSSEIIATTNSKGDIIPKRPDKLNIAMNMNKKLTEEIEAVIKSRENYSAESMETMKLEDDCVLNSIGDESEKDTAGSPFYADPVDALKEAALPPVQRRKLLRVGVNLSQRYSEPPTQNHPYYPLRDMHSIEELSPSSPNTSSSVDNLMSLRTKPKMKPVQPPRVATKPPSDKNDEGSNSENGTFPSLAEQECRLSAVDDGTQHLTVHQVVAQRFPDLRLNAEPTMLPEEVRSPPRASCYDNVHDLRPLSEQASDDGTVFSEPWDSSQWDGLIPPSNGHQLYDNDEPCEWESPIPRRGPAAATRAKSFRDRLDPLLAAGRVRALRGGRQTRGAGAALRAYALHLAQDKSTTFAQNIDNFIACTLDSKDTSPQVMMRNMRQFMSGMKNYLVKHGEREFEKEVEKERLKLKPTEFLNLDAILEGVMHRLVVRPLRARLYSLLAAWHSADVRRLHAAIERAQHATPLQLGIKESTRVPSSAVLAVISKHFLKMQEADSPLDKLENLLAAISVMFNAIRGERSVGADDLLPVLAWTIARSRLVCAELEAELMAGLLPAALLAGEGGYYLTALFSAVAVLKRLAPEPQSDSTSPWRRGSVDTGREQCSVAVVRVVLPDECRGSIRRVPVPCRPGARARDLCRALAHAAAITNPQDYALFALHDGHETMLNENDCPQEVMSEKSGQNFTLAYRRIDAKIAWPQQALLSYP